MESQNRPNIVLIMADDHAAKSISCYGAGINSTPNIDRLANEGMLFNHCYVTNSICTLSRAAILCGTYNHVNNVTTLDLKLNSRLPNVAKQLQTGGYQTAVGEYWDPQFIEPDLKMGKSHTIREAGYATDVITDKCIDWMQKRDKQRPFFLMCHHKAPHRSWECDNKHKHLYRDPVRLPDTFTYDNKNRANAAKVANMRVAEDLTYSNLVIVQPEGPSSEVGEKMIDVWWWNDRKIPAPEDVTKLKLVCKDDGTVFTFKTKQELAEFKFQRYMQRYLRTIQSIDDNVRRMLEWLESENLAENTIIVYTSDQSFFLGEHGWFDCRESILEK